MPAGWGGLETLWADLPAAEDGSGKEMPAAGIKAEEEIAKFTVDEHLSEVERTILYLNGGQLIQQRHAIVNLPAVVKGRGRPAFDAIAQPLKAALNRLDTEAQVATAEAFANIARERLLSPVDLQVCILPVVTRSINREKSDDETDAWLNTLFELAPLLDKEVLKSEVLSLALSKGDVEGSVSSRTICARILGALAPRLTWDEIDRTFFRKALSMCQDVDHHIRISSCQQLAAIARIAGKDVTAKTILPELFELLNDESLEARVAGLTTLAGVLDILPPEVRKGQVMPILRNHMQPLELDIVVQRAVARVFGQVVTQVKADFEHDDSLTFFGCFKHLAAKSDVELRRTCAGQLPAVLKAASALSANAFQQWQDTVNALACDSDAEVRRALAGVIHELARIAGKDCPTLLSRSLCRLLRDESQAVQAAVLPNLTATLQHWQIKDEARREAAMAEVARALVDMEAGIKRSWRMQQQLAVAFPSFPQVFSSDQIFEHFLPIAWRYLSSTAAAVRPTAAEGVACFFRCNRKEKQRAELYLRVIRDLCRAKSYTQRIAFAELAQHLVRRFSSRWVKEYVFDMCLELLYDPVPNVRIVVTSVLPGLKQCIRLPEDVDLLERLNSAMSNTMTDNDRDVSQNARALNDLYKKTPMRMGGPGGMLDMTGTAGSSIVSTEADDGRKEEEESDFTFAADDLKEIKTEILQVSAGKKGGALAGKSANGRRVAALGPLPGERTSAPSLSTRAAYAGGPAKRIGNNSDDGTGGRPSPPSPLNAVRPPPSALGGGGAGRGAAAMASAGSAMSAAAKSMGGGAASVGSGGSAGSKATSSTAGGASRLGNGPPPLKTPSSASTPTISMGSPTGGSSAPGTPGVRLPAISARAGSGAGSPSSPGGPMSAKGGAAATRLTGSPSSGTSPGTPGSKAAMAAGASSAGMRKAGVR